MSSFGANYRQLLVCDVVTWTISRRENTIFTSSLERHRFLLLLKKYETMRNKNHPILFPMYCLMILAKVFHCDKVVFLVFR